MRDTIRNLLLAIVAGIAIGIGGTVFLSVDNKVVGSVLFAVGLYIICVQGFNLFTGKVGYLVGQKAGYLGFLGIVWLGNLIGTFVTGAAVRITRIVSITEKAQSMCQVKNDDSYLSLFVLAIGCGILMFAAVDCYKKCSNPLIIVFCVAVFILCGFEHCIADMFYYSAAGMWSLNVLLRIVIISVGNGLGGVLVPLVMLLKPSKE